MMNHKLAQALMEAGVQHFDGGGLIGSIGGGIQGIASDFTAQNQYQASLAPTDHTDYGGNIAGSYQNANAGYGNAQALQAQQQQLANQLLSQSQGQGPNPVQAALAQNTGNNVQAQAALMASQRGAGANAGLVARQAAMQGGAQQQQATGQAATLGAQQQLAAQQQLQAQQQNMAGNNIAEQGVNANLYGVSAGAQNAQNNTAVENYGQMNGINSQIAQNNSNAVNKTNGSLLNGIGGGAQMLAGKFAQGGKVPLPEHLQHVGSIYHPNMYARGGNVPDLNNSVAVAASYGGKEKAQDDTGGTTPPVASPASMGGGPSLGASTDLGPGLAPSSLSFMQGAAALKSGGQVGGKASVKGNSYKNDNVPALLSPGEVVLPRSVTQSDNAPDKAAEFVRHLQSKSDKAGKKSGGFKDVDDSNKELTARVAALEKIIAKKKGK